MREIVNVNDVITFSLEQSCCHRRTGVKRRKVAGGSVQRPMTLSGDAPFLTSEWLPFITGCYREVRHWLISESADFYFFLRKFDLLLV